MANLASVKYVGHLPAVEIDFDGFGEVVVVKNETVKVPSDVLPGLLAQPNNWKVADSPASFTPKKAEEAK